MKDKVLHSFMKKVQDKRLKMQTSAVEMSTGWLLGWLPSRQKEYPRSKSSGVAVILIDYYDDGDDGGDVDGKEDVDSDDDVGR